jgi:plastocyanin
MFIRLIALIRLAFTIEFALAVTGGIFLLGFLTALGVGSITHPGRSHMQHQPQQPQQLSIVSPTTLSPTSTATTSLVTGAGNTPVPTAATPVTMTAQGASFAFTPTTLTVHVATTVVWQNTSTVPHTVVGPGYDSGLVMPGHSFSHTFTQTGTFTYTCTLHTGMSGTITVIP